MICEKCDHSNLDGQKFCGECSLRHDSGAGPTSQPSHLPEAGERRQATIVFSDLSGYTAMNERVDPAEVQGIAGRIKAGAVRIVESFHTSKNHWVGIG